MVRVIQPNVPPEWIPLFEKIFRWFERNGTPIWARRWFQDSRTIKQQKKKQSEFQSAGQSWTDLDGSIKALWNQAAYRVNGYFRGYRLFTSDYIYRKSANLSLPGTPSNLHQLFGLKISNPGGSGNVFARRDDKDIVGQLNIKFSYKKNEITPSGTKAFKVVCTAYHLTQGGYSTDVDTFTADAGDEGWQIINRTFGTTDRKYFHFKIVFTIDGYDAIIHLDNIVLSDKNGEFFRESFNTEAYSYWTPNMLYRKRDWVFNPAYIKTYFNHEYLL